MHLPRDTTEELLSGCIVQAGLILLNMNSGCCNIWLGF
jgi:hypothetical protein